MTGTMMTRIALFAIGIVSITMVGCTDDATAPTKGGTFYGSSVTMGNGKARTFVKLGEEAMVDLSAFTMEGGQASKHRQALRRLEKEHARMDDPHIESDAPERVRALLAELPDRYEQILRLRFLESCSLKEAAQTMNISVGNAKVLQHRALQRAADVQGGNV